MNNKNKMKYKIMIKLNKFKYKNEKIIYFLLY